MRRRPFIFCVVGIAIAAIAWVWKAVDDEKYSPRHVRELLVSDTAAPSVLDRLLMRVGWHRPSDPDEIAGKIVALGPKGVPGLVAALSDSDQRVRRRAAWALGQVGDPAGVGPLIAALNDQNSSVRGEAARALGGLRDHRAVAPLTHILAYDTVHEASADRPFSRSYGVFTGLSARPVSFAAAEALCRIGHEEALNALAAYCIADRTDGPTRLASALRDSEPADRDRVIAAVKARDRDAGARLAEHVRFWTRIDTGKQ